MLRFFATGFTLLGLVLWSIVTFGRIFLGWKFATVADLYALPADFLVLGFTLSLLESRRKT